MKKRNYDNEPVPKDSVEAAQADAVARLKVILTKVLEACE